MYQKTPFKKWASFRLKVFIKIPHIRFVPRIYKSHNSVIKRQFNTNMSILNR